MPNWISLMENSFRFLSAVSLLVVRHTIFSSVPHYDRSLTIAPR